MAAALPFIVAGLSGVGTAHTISESSNARRANARNLRRQETLLTEQKEEMEAQLKAERTAADQTARNAAASRQRALLAQNTPGGSRSRSGTLLTGPRGLGSTTLLGY